MKKVVTSIVALAFLVVAYESTALGAGSTGAQGEIQFVKVNPCALTFSFTGFSPGAQGRLEVLMNGTVYTLRFHVPAEKGFRGWNLHDLIGFPHPDTFVRYRIAAQGASHVLSGSQMCDCGEGEGGSGGNGGNGGSGGSGGSESTTSTAGAATAVTSQPGFAG
jgi:hypothetical protein